MLFRFFFTSGLQHAFVLFSDSIAQPAPGRCRFERVWDFPTSILQRKMVFVYTKTLLAGLLVIYPSALTTTKRFIFLTPFKLRIFV